MGYSRDFEAVIDQGDGSLRVDATSIDNDTGEAGSKDPAVAFHVALTKAPAGGNCRVSERVEGPVGASWSAVLPGAAPTFEDNPDVYVIGIATLGDGALEVWQERHTIGTRSGDPLDT